MVEKIKCSCGITFKPEEGQTHCNYCGIKLSGIKKKRINSEKEIKKTIKTTGNETPKKFLTILLALTILFSAVFYIRAENKEKELRSKDFKSNVPTPIPSFPVDKLELQNVKYDGETLTGLVLNKGDKAAFNTKLSLKISKDRRVWSIEEQHDFTVPYKIDPNQSVKFSESFKTTKTNPWTATAIVEAKYYNGENVPTPTLKPIAKDYIAPKPTSDHDPIIDCNIHASCGGGSRQMKKSECNQLACCELGRNSWSLYPNKAACTQAQNNYNSSNTSGANNYPPCTVYYPALHTSSTYSYTSPETCKQWQNTANAGSINTPSSTPQPTYSYQPPTPDYKTLLRDCIEQAKSEYDSMMAYLGTLGASSSSAADAAAANRDEEYKQCQNLYGN